MLTASSMHEDQVHAIASCFFGYVPTLEPRFDCTVPEDHLLQQMEPIVFNNSPYPVSPLPHSAVSGSIAPAMADQALHFAPIDDPACVTMSSHEDLSSPTGHDASMQDRGTPDLVSDSTAASSSSRALADGMDIVDVISSGLGLSGGKREHTMVPKDSKQSSLHLDLDLPSLASERLGHFEVTASPSGLARTPSASGSFSEQRMSTPPALVNNTPSEVELGCTSGVFRARMPEPSSGKEEQSPWKTPKSTRTPGGRGTRQNTTPARSQVNKENESEWATPRA